jgi:5-methylcytosine-specific restriction endonuclease McrA
VAAMCALVACSGEAEGPEVSRLPPPGPALQQLLGHAVPNGDLATLVERAFDALLVQEKKRRFGAGKPRKRRLPKPGSRYIPVELVREVTQRDGGQCTFVDENGNRCSARAQLTLEHRHPFALGGATTAENLCLLCAAHNRHTARKAFGEEHVEQRILEAEYERTHVALRKAGFRDHEARKALAILKQTSRATRTKDLLVEALAVLVPAVPAPTTWSVRDSSGPRWPLRILCLSRDGFDPMRARADLHVSHRHRLSRT